MMCSVRLKLAPLWGEDFFPVVGKNKIILKYVTQEETQEFPSPYLDILHILASYRLQLSLLTEK